MTNMVGAVTCLVLLGLAAAAPPVIMLTGGTLTEVYQVTLTINSFTIAVLLYKLAFGGRDDRWRRW